MNCSFGVSLNSRVTIGAILSVCILATGACTKSGSDRENKAKAAKKAKIVATDTIDQLSSHQPILEKDPNEILQKVADAQNEIGKNAVYNLEADGKMEVCAGDDRRVLIPYSYRLRDRELQSMRRNHDKLTNLILALADGDYDSAEKYADSLVLGKGKLMRLARSDSELYAAYGVKTYVLDAEELLAAVRSRNLTKSLKAYGKVMRSCNECHRSFRLTEWPRDKQYKSPAKATPVWLPSEFEIRPQTEIVE